MASCVSGGNVGAGVFVTVGGRGVRVLVGVTIVGVGEASVGVAEGDGGSDVSVDWGKDMGSGAVLLGLTVAVMTCAAGCASASGWLMGCSSGSAQDTSRDSIDAIMSMCGIFLTD